MQIFLPIVIYLGLKNEVPLDKSKNSIITLVEFYRGDWKEIFSILLFGITVGIFTLVVPLAAQTLVNTVAFATLLQPLIVLTAAVAFFLLVSSFLKVVQFYLVEKLAQRLFVRIALDVSRSLPMVHYELFKRNFGSEYINRFLEIVTVQKATTSLLLEGSAVVFQLIFAIVLLGFYHPFFLAFSIIVAYTLFFVVTFLGKNAIPTSLEESDQKYGILAWLEDISASPAFFKSSNGKQEAVRRTDSLLCGYVNARQSHFRILLSQQIVVLILQVVGSATLLGIGGILVTSSQLSLGQLVAAELILSVIINCTDKLTKFLETFYDLVAGIMKLDTLVSLPRDCSDSKEILIDSNIGYTIGFEAISHILSNHETLLEDINFQVQSGEKVLIYGGNGVGKSVLADLLAGYKSPFKGKILIDGTPIDFLDMHIFRSSIALVRGIEVIHGTIEDNLRLARANITAREIQEVLTDLGLISDIESLGDGMRTYLRGDYAPLSLGQAERLMIARALLQRTRMIIFDGSLDVVDEGMLGRTIDTIKKHALQTTVLVTSRERDSIEFFEKVYEIRNKQIVQIK